MQKSIKKFRSNANVFGLEGIDLDCSGSLRVDAISVINKFQEICDNEKWDFDYFVRYISLLDEGVLEIPLVCHIGDKAFSVFFIYTLDDAKKYKDALLKVKQTKYPNTIYFSGFDIDTVFDKMLSTRTLQLSDLRLQKDKSIHENYAMWWPELYDDRFSVSESKEILESIYDIHKDYESVFVGYILCQIGLIEDLERAQLPKDEKALILIGPENKTILLILSQEKGIRFLFPINSTSKFYREQFLSAIRIDFLSLRLSLQQQNIPKDEAKEMHSRNWFKNMLKIVEQKENEGKQINSIGSWSNNEGSFGVN